MSGTTHTAPAAVLTVLAAVDVAAGRAAQAVGGGDDDPWSVASGWVRQGAPWIHLVDLDRAFGRGDNADLLAEIVDRLPVPVQLSGGLADEAALDWAASTGAARVVLASGALADPGLVHDALARHGRRLVVAMDVRDGVVVSRGTPLELGPVREVLAANPALRQAAYVLVADASRDGTRDGADLDLFGEVAGLLAAEVIASGGVASVEDLRGLAALSGLGVRHVVLGSALYHGAVDLRQALEVCR